MVIRPHSSEDTEAVVLLSLRAWDPVFESMRATMDEAVYRTLYPDWKVVQHAAVEAVCSDENQKVWVAVIDEEIVGFASVILHAKDSIGEIYMLAVDPSQQKRGIGAALTEHALAWIKQAGMGIAMVNTGGDPGHAPARRVYERVGFRVFPAAHFYKKL